MKYGEKYDFSYRDYSNVVFLVKGGKHRSMSKLFCEVR